MKCSDFAWEFSLKSTTGPQDGQTHSVGAIDLEANNFFTEFPPELVDVVRNQDGERQSEELFTLAQKAIASISLNASGTVIAQALSELHGSGWVRCRHPNKRVHRTKLRMKTIFCPREMSVECHQKDSCWEFIDQGNVRKELSLILLRWNSHSRTCANGRSRFVEHGGANVC